MLIQLGIAFEENKNGLLISFIIYNIKIPTLVGVYILWIYWNKLLTFYLLLVELERSSTNKNKPWETIPTTSIVTSFSNYTFF